MPRTNDRVSFTCRTDTLTSGTRTIRFQLFTCRETGLRYCLEEDDLFDCWLAYRHGEQVATRMERGEALRWVEQTASLDFLTAQTESAWNEIETIDWQPAWTIYDTQTPFTA